MAAGISSRGNDDPAALDNRSTSPVRFLHDLGAAYRASGRTRPIMDALGFHPYPRASTDPLLRPLDWPNASFANLGRIRQAVWDAFHGTRQPTTENGLRILIDEVGWQAAVPVGSQLSYTGLETVPVASERAQAAVYGELVRRAACDPTIAGVFLFPLLDEPDLERFQSGVLRADGSRRPSFAAVSSAVAATRAGCRGRALAWHPTTRVAGARASFAATARTNPARRRWWGFTVRAAEDAQLSARVVRLRPASAPPRSLAGARGGRIVLRAEGKVRAGHAPLVRFPLRTLPAGTYAYVVELRAAMSPARRTTIVSRPFGVAAP